MAQRVESVPEDVWDWIGDGDEIQNIAVIRRPHRVQWTNNDAALAMVRMIRHGSVHLGLMGEYEGNPAAPCGIGRWGTDDAPDWPQAWEDLGISEPNTYGLLGRLAERLRQAGDGPSLGKGDVGRVQRPRRVP